VMTAKTAGGITADAPVIRSIAASKERSID